MKHSAPNIYSPIVFDSEHTKAWFTYKNPDLAVDGQKVNGLNLGFNTIDPETVVIKKRDILFQSLGLTSEQVAFAEQVHGTVVKLAEEPGLYPATDALISNRVNLPLAIQVADCAAILLSDDTNNVIAAIHAGWRGAVGGILEKTLDKMRVLGAQMEHMKAYVSPCIGMKNFEVGEEVAKQFPERFVQREGFSKPHVDLTFFLLSILEKFGVNNVENSGFCTYEHADQFYSFRREGKKSGRMLGIITMTNKDV